MVGLKACLPSAWSVHGSAGLKIDGHLLDPPLLLLPSDDHESPDILRSHLSFRFLIRLYTLLIFLDTLAETSVGGGRMSFVVAQKSSSGSTSPSGPTALEYDRLFAKLFYFYDLAVGLGLSSVTSPVCDLSPPHSFSYIALMRVSCDRSQTFCNFMSFRTQSAANMLPRVTEGIIRLPPAAFGVLLALSIPPPRSARPWALPMSLPVS